MNFRTVNLAAAALCALLFLCLLFLPALAYWLFGITGNEEADFLARRSAMLFLGFAVLCWNASSLADLNARRAVSLAVAVAMAGLAIASVGEFARGFAGPGILLAASAEAVFAALYFRFWRNET
jgi:hypothetical protein